MSKSKKNFPKAAKKTMRWHLGVFISAKSGDLVAVYARKDGTVVDYYSKAVTSKKAKFHAVYKNMTYAEARAALMRDAAKAGIKPAPKKEQKKEKAPKQSKKEEHTQRPQMKKAA